jgi:hypothetical protein
MLSWARESRSRATSRLSGRTFAISMRQMRSCSPTHVSATQARAHEQHAELERQLHALIDSQRATITALEKLQREPDVEGFLASMEAVLNHLGVVAGRRAESVTAKLVEVIEGCTRLVTSWMSTRKYCGVTPEDWSPPRDAHPAPR